MSKTFQCTFVFYFDFCGGFYPSLQIRMEPKTEWLFFFSYEETEMAIMGLLWLIGWWDKHLVVSNQQKRIGCGIWKNSELSALINQGKKSFKKFWDRFEICLCKLKKKWYLWCQQKCHCLYNTPNMALGGRNKHVHKTWFHFSNGSHPDMTYLTYTPVTTLTFQSNNDIWNDKGMEWCKVVWKGRGMANSINDQLTLTHAWWKTQKTSQKERVLNHYLIGKR